MRRGSLAELAAHYARRRRRRRARSSSASARRWRAVRAEKDIDRLLLSLAGEMPASKAAAEAARMTGLKKPDLYRRLLELRDAADGEKR